MLNNPGKTMTVYDIPKVVATAFPLAVTPGNIKAGFRASGIYPFNREVFLETAFAPASTTDRAEPSTQPTPPLLPREPSTRSGQRPVTPEELRPYPKAAARKGAQKQKRMSSCILTDTPEKERIEQEKAASMQKKKMATTSKRPSAPQPRPVAKPSASQPRPAAKPSAYQPRPAVKPSAPQPRPAAKPSASQCTPPQLEKAASKKKKQKRKRQEEDSSSDEEDCFCLVCMETFSHSCSGKV